MKMDMWYLSLAQMSLKAQVTKESRRDLLDSAMESSKESHLTLLLLSMCLRSILTEERRLPADITVIMESILYLEPIKEPSTLPVLKPLANQEWKYPTAESITSINPTK
jgi:hypothetical protein